jgi:hypothetical protein
MVAIGLQWTRSGHWPLACALFVRVMPPSHWVQGFQPISSTLLHLPPAPSGASVDTAATAAASLTLPHSGATVDGAAQDLVLILLAMGVHLLYDCRVQITP